jgi:sugar phosphate isomerase/epimerase
MIPALSTRLAEPPGRKDASLLTLADFCRLARELGYRALSMRASQVSVESAPEAVDGARRTLDEHGLGVVMVTGTVSLAANDARATEPLRHITPHLDLAEKLGGTLVRVMLQREEDIPFAARAAAEAGERGMKLAHQTHIGTLCETVDSTLEAVRKVGSPHFGITFEPSNMLVCGSEWGRGAVQRLAPHIVNVYLQNWRPHAGGALTLQLNAGPIKADQIALDDASGVDYAAVFDALREIDWTGYVTVHQSLMPGETVETAAYAHMAAVRKFLGAA